MGSRRSQCIKHASIRILYTATIYTMDRCNCVCVCVCMSWFESQHGDGFCYRIAITLLYTHTHTCRNMNMYMYVIWASYWWQNWRKHFQTKTVENFRVHIIHVYICIILYSNVNVRTEQLPNCTNFNECDARSTSSTKAKRGRRVRTGQSFCYSSTSNSVKLLLLLRSLCCCCCCCHCKYISMTFI